MERSEVASSSKCSGGGRYWGSNQWPPRWERVA